MIPYFESNFGIDMTKKKKEKFSKKRVIKLQMFYQEGNFLFSNLNLNQNIEKEEYKIKIKTWQNQISKLQRSLKEEKIGVIVLFEGWDASGKGTLMNELILPLDPRGFTVFNINKPTQEEQMRPYMYRFWAKTPPKGRIALFNKSWYSSLIESEPDTILSNREKKNIYSTINSFENQLWQEDTIIIKLFIHISKKEQEKRIKDLQSKDETKWKITKSDLKNHQNYNENLKLIQSVFEYTNTEISSWNIIEGTHKRFASLKMFEVLSNELTQKMDQIIKRREKQKIQEELKVEKEIKSFDLDKIDCNKEIAKKEYKNKLKAYQKRIRELEYEIYKRRIPVVVAYEGWDAAGKGGNIKRLTQNLDPRGYEVIPVAAPSDIEKQHHYLWRFWTQFPKAGHLAIFDRTWYGRVLVERVEKFATQEEYKRAYREINEMEKQWSDFGCVILKFWLHIDQNEQLERFNERVNDENKNWKITDEDWRNREKWQEYKEAVEDMVLKTSTSYSNWHIIEANSKEYARLKVLKITIQELEKALSKKED